MRGFSKNLGLMGNIAILLVICCYCLSATAKYGGGTGEPNDPYLILDANQMQAIGADSNDWDKHFKLMADIDLSAYTGTQFKIIGRWIEWDDYANHPFAGVFDGNNHKVCSFTWKSSNRDGIGLFGYVGKHGRIENLILENMNIDAEDGGYIGGLVGCNEGTIINCYSVGSVRGAGGVGGLAGNNYGGNISYCYSTISVTGVGENDYEGGCIGGLVGDNEGTIIDCNSTGSVRGEWCWCVGGLVGLNSCDGAVSKCCSTATVTGSEEVGGLVGYNVCGTISQSCSEGGVTGVECVGGLVGWNNRKVENCYSTGNVGGSRFAVGGLAGHNGGAITRCYSTSRVAGIAEYTGGLVGNNSGTVKSSYWDVETSGQSNSSGGTGKNTEEMKTAKTFFAWGACANEGIWTIDEGNDYPRLAWEGRYGQPLPTQRLSDYMSGGGTETRPYLIYTAEQLNLIGLFACEWDKHFVLANDIDLSEYGGTQFNRIGVNGTPFTGVFDGKDNRIWHFTWNSGRVTNVGLFSLVGEVGQIKNLGLEDVDIEAGAGSCVGGLAGTNDGEINNCYSKGSLSAMNCVGGLVGVNDQGAISCCYSMSKVLGDQFVGGLVGKNSYGTITSCHSIGSISGNFSVGGLAGLSHGTIKESYSGGDVREESGIIRGDIGGLVGRNTGAIRDSYSTSSVTGERNIGGLVGHNYKTITNCYSTGSVTGGGLVGFSWDSTIVSFWDIETSGQSYSHGGIGKSTAEMQKMSTFIDAGWDFVGETVNGIDDIWFIGQGDYPRLWWEGMHVPMNLTPRTLNCRSEGNRVKAHLTLPQGFTVADVDTNRPAVLHSFGFESAPLYVFVNENGLVQIEAAFERESVCSLAGDWPDELTVTGFLSDGNIFLGTSKVRIIAPKIK